MVMWDAPVALWDLFLPPRDDEHERPEVFTYVRSCCFAANFDRRFLCGYFGPVVYRWYVHMYVVRAELPYVGCVFFSY